MKRTLRLGRHRLEFNVETGEEAARVQAPVAELADTKKAHVWSRRWSYGTRRPRPSEDGRVGNGRSASWYNTLTAAGAALAAVGLVDGDWRLALAGLAAVTFGAWSAMRRLSSGVSLRGFGWVVVEVSVVLAAAGVIFALGLEGPAMWLAVLAIVFASPFIASRVSGVHEVD
jgi:hypothetical protein